MKVILVGIGDIGATGEVSSSIKTMALGSCVAIVLMDHVTKTAGMAHVALPDSTINQEKCREKPGYFADTALAALLAEMSRAGSTGDIKNMFAKIVGGANVLKAANNFDIGKRNVLAVKKALWALGTGPVAEDVGGDISRTVAIHIETGITEITCPGRGKWLL